MQRCCDELRNGAAESAQGDGSHATHRCAAAPRVTTARDLTSYCRWTIWYRSREGAHVATDMELTKTRPNSACIPALLLRAPLLALRLLARPADAVVERGPQPVHLDGPLGALLLLLVVLARALFVVAQLVLERLHLLHQVLALRRRHRIARAALHGEPATASAMKAAGDERRILVDRVRASTACVS